MPVSCLSPWIERSLPQMHGHLELWLARAGIIIKCSNNNKTTNIPMSAPVGQPKSPLTTMYWMMADDAMTMDLEDRVSEVIQTTTTTTAGGKEGTAAVRRQRGRQTQSASSG